MSALDPKSETLDNIKAAMALRHIAYRGWRDEVVGKTVKGIIMNNQNRYTIILFEDNSYITFEPDDEERGEPLIQGVWMDADLNPWDLKLLGLIDEETLEQIQAELKESRREIQDGREYANYVRLRKKYKEFGE